MCCCCFRTTVVDQLESPLLQYVVSYARTGEALVALGFCGAGRSLFYEVAMRLAGMWLKGWLLFIGLCILNSETLSRARRSISWVFMGE